MNRNETEYIRSPDRVIDELIAKEDWFSGFANSVTYFEHYGYFAIRAYCVREGVELKGKAINLLRRNSAGNVTLLLRILKIIDDKSYSDMRKIIGERNNLVHPGRKGLAYRYAKKKDEYTVLLNKAKECIVRVKSQIKLK